MYISKRKKKQSEVFQAKRSHVMIFIVIYESMKYFDSVQKKKQLEIKIIEAYSRFNEN